MLSPVVDSTRHIKRVRKAGMVSGILKGNFPCQDVSEFIIHDDMLTGPLMALSMYR